MRETVMHTLFCVWCFVPSMRHLYRLQQDREFGTGRYWETGDHWVVHVLNLLRLSGKQAYLFCPQSCGLYALHSNGVNGETLVSASE